MDAAAVASNRARLDQFVRRARRVRAHSLFDDPAQLLSYARAESKVRFEVVDGKPTPVSFRWVLPPEEQLESLAARLRPFTLDNENVKLPKVLKSIKFLGEDSMAEQDVARLASLSKAFVSTMTGQAFSVEHEDQGKLSPRVTNVQLAEAWLYGDVVHNSVDRHPDAMGYSIKERFTGASALYCGVAVLIAETLHFTLKYREVLGLAEESLSMPVTVAEVPERETQEMRLSVAEVGTTPPEPGMTPVGPDWRPFSTEDLEVSVETPRSALPVQAVEGD